MKILIDEDLPRAIANMLLEKGFEAEHVIDIGMRGKPDEEILRYARNNGAILITADLDFADIRHYPIGSHQGIIVLRFPDYFRREQILSLVRSFIDTSDITLLKGALVVVEPGAYRIRR